MTTPVPAALAAALSMPTTPQGPFAWSREGWTRWLASIDGVPGFLAEYPPQVGRADTAAVVQRELAAGRTENAFVAAMIWGHGKSNYGGYRTAAVLAGQDASAGLPADPAVIAKLAEAARLAAEGDGGGVAAFQYLANEGRVVGLGPAFFTKWTYFASATGGHHSEAAAPILDAVVQEWMLEHAAVRLRTWRTADYERYDELLRQWGSEHRRTAVQVEETIFRIARRGGPV